MLSLILGIGAVFLEGLAFMLGWNWFITPFGLCNMTFFWGLGICLIFTLMTLKGVNITNEDTKAVQSFTKTALKCIAIGLIIGEMALVHCFM